MENDRIGRPFKEGAKTKKSIWLIAVAMLALPRLGQTQELEPRAYRTIPVGMNFLAFTYNYQEGNILTDPTAPVEDLELKAGLGIVSYLRSFGLFGRSSSFSFSVPYGYMTGSGSLQGERLKRNRSGSGDIRGRLLVNLLGGPAMDMKEYAAFGQRRNLGVSLTVLAPTGHYESDRVVNFGTNRWAFKPEIGYSSIRGKWIFDGAAGIWLITAKDEFLGGTKREQDPIGSFQAHISRDLRTGLWLALDLNYFSGGRSTINGVEKADLQQNSRVGLTLSYVMKKHHWLKFAAATGAFTSIGADFDRFTLAYTYNWGGRPKPVTP